MKSKNESDPIKIKIKTVMPAEQLLTQRTQIPARVAKRAM
jgi:hypothetical protein